MATTLDLIPIKSLHEYSKFVEKNLQKAKDKTLWFRGAGRVAYPLSPSLHRNLIATTPEQIIALETTMMERFNQRSVPFLPKPFDYTSDWEVLFFMQHYGIPTRLLDWTENPFMALYFSLTSAKYEMDGKIKNYTDDAAVWVLDPCAWNRESLKDFSYKRGILSIHEQLLNGFKPKELFANLRENPVAIFGIHNSPRIVAQRGVFTVFGKSIRPMEDIFSTENFPVNCLRKLIFDKNKIDSLLTSLTSLGITDSVAYPDLEGLAKELKRFFKFEI